MTYNNEQIKHLGFDEVVNELSNTLGVLSSLITEPDIDEQFEVSRNHLTIRTKFIRPSKIKEIKNIIESELIWYRGHKVEQFQAYEKALKERLKELHKEYYYGKTN